MQDIIAALISFFLVVPLETALADHLAATRAPQAAIAEVTGCVRTAAPAIADRAMQDPWWAVTGAITLWMGSASPEKLFVDAAPGCIPALEAVRGSLMRTGA